MDRGGRINNGRTESQRVVGRLVSRRTYVPPHLTLALGNCTEYAKGVGCCRFMAAWVREKEKGKASENRQREKEREEKDMVEVAPRMTVGSSF